MPGMGAAGGCIHLPVFTVHTEGRPRLALQLELGLAGRLSPYRGVVHAEASWLHPLLTPASSASHPSTHPHHDKQVIFALPAQNGTDYSMRIFNSDGSEPEMCGNGIRCLARFVAGARCGVVVTRWMGLWFPPRARQGGWSSAGWGTG